MFTDISRVYSYAGLATVSTISKKVVEDVVNDWNKVWGWLEYLMWWIIGIVLAIVALIVLALLGKFGRMCRCLCRPCTAISRAKKHREERIMRQMIEEIYVDKLRKKDAKKKKKSKVITANKMRLQV